MKLRKRTGMEYFVDHLARFHAPMENIVLAIKGKTVSTLSNKDTQLIRYTLPEASKLWCITSNSRFDANLYEFDANKAKTLKALIKK